MFVSQNVESEDKKLSHKEWRAQIKKLRRKNKRQLEAKQRDELTQAEQAALERSAEYLRQQLLKQRQEKFQKRYEEKLRHELHDRWLEREEKAQKQILLAKARAEKEKQLKEEEEQRIREEWEEQQKIDKEEAERKTKEDDERKSKQVKQDSLSPRNPLPKTACPSDCLSPRYLEGKMCLLQQLTDLIALQDDLMYLFAIAELLKEATANEKKGDGPWHNPIAPAGSVREREVCPFFSKVGVCRFAERCSRAHPEPEVCNTLLLPGMYASFKLEQSQRDEYDTDLGLEYDDKDIYREFKEFYQDVVPEFKAIGKVVQFKVCCNYEAHLRGNVYVQYAKEEDAHQAMTRFNSRWYAGRQLSCYYVQIRKWCSAICGQFFNKRCPKGKSCNFLHVFQNPGGEFREADFDRDRPGHYSQRDDRSYRSARSSIRRHHRSRSRSPRRSRSHRKRSYSRSNSRSPRRRNSPDYYRRSSRSHRKRSQSRSRSRSKQKSRSRRPSSRSPGRKRSQKDKSRSQSRSPKRNERHQSRSRSRSESRDRFRNNGLSSTKTTEKNSDLTSLNISDIPVPPDQANDTPKHKSNGDEAIKTLNSVSDIYVNENTINSSESITPSYAPQPSALNDMSIEVINGEEQMTVTTPWSKKKRKKNKKKTSRSRSRSSSSCSRSRSESPSTKHKHKKHKKHKHKKKSDLANLESPHVSEKNDKSVPEADFILNT